MLLLYIGNMSRSRSRSPRSRSRSPPRDYDLPQLESWMKPPPFVQEQPSTMTNPRTFTCIEEKVANERALSPKPSYIELGVTPPSPSTCSLYFDGMGDGGCLAVALSALHILGASFDDVCEKLDSCIDIVHRRLVDHNESRGQSPCSRALAGINRTQWNPCTVKEAMLNEYGLGGFIFKKQSIDSRWYETPGHYIIDGFLNRTYMKVGPRGGIKKIHQDGWKVNNSRNEWRHCIAVKIDDNSGQFFCAGVGRWAPIKDYLWLDNKGHPDSTMGYMEAICKVYEVKDLSV